MIIYLRMICLYWEIQVRQNQNQAQTKTTNVVRIQLQQCKFENNMYDLFMKLFNGNKMIQFNGSW